MSAKEEAERARQREAGVASFRRWRAVEAARGHR